MMQWTLPSEEWETPNGVLHLERGNLAGRRYDLTASICNNPVCQCGLVSLRCTPVDDETGPPSSSAPVCLEMNVVVRRIDNLEALKPHAEAVALAEAVATEMSDSDWNRLSELYIAAKRHYTECADPDQIEAEFPAEVIVQGSMVGYYEILPFAAQITVVWNGQSWLFDDQYCVIPKCSCHQAAISFQPLPPESEGTIKNVLKLPEHSAIALRYDYHSGQIEMLPESSGEDVSGRGLMAELGRAQADLNNFFVKRHELLRRLYQKFRNRKTARMPARKPGRNDPCPCGSGKKFKKCCGA